LKIFQKRNVYKQWEYIKTNIIKTEVIIRCQQEEKLQAADQGVLHHQKEDHPQEEDKRIFLSVI